MELIDRHRSLHREKFINTGSDFLLRLFELRHVGRDLLSKLGGEVFAERIRDDEIAVGESLHER